MSVTMHDLEWPFLGLIIFLQLVHIMINIGRRLYRCKKLRGSQENPQRCRVSVRNTPRNSAQGQHNVVSSSNPTPSTSRDPNFVPTDEYAVVDSMKRKNNRFIGIEPVTDVKYNVHQEDQIYKNVIGEDYQNANALCVESDYQAAWSGTPATSAIKVSKKLPFVRNTKK